MSSSTATTQDRDPAQNERVLGECLSGFTVARCALHRARVPLGAGEVPTLSGRTQRVRRALAVTPLTVVRQAGWQPERAESHTDSDFPGFADEGRCSPQTCSGIWLGQPEEGGASPQAIPTSSKGNQRTSGRGPHP